MTRTRLARADLLRADLALGVDFVPRVHGNGDSHAQVEVAPLPRAELDAGQEESAPLLHATTAAITLEFACDERLVQPGESRCDALERLRAQHAESCAHCTRASGFTNLVFGEGSAEARLVFVGEAPGESEDLSGRPFVGKAGQKLDEMIAAMGLQRSGVYIANVLKARPPNNRTPLPEEVMRCGPTLLKQLAIIRPEVIVTLGAPAAKFLLQTDVGITRLRGVWAAWQIPTALGSGQIAVMPTFHPAYLLRNYTPETRKAVWSDLVQVMKRLQDPSTAAN